MTQIQELAGIVENLASEVDQITLYFEGFNEDNVDKSISLLKTMIVISEAAISQSQGSFIADEHLCKTVNNTARLAASTALSILSHGDVAAHTKRTSEFYTRLANHSYLLKECVRSGSDRNQIAA